MFIAPMRNLVNGAVGELVIFKEHMIGNVGGIGKEMTVRDKV